MELIGILFIAFIIFLFLKLIALFFDVAIFAIALPFKILAIVFGAIFGVFLLIPLGLFAGLLGLLIAPLAIIGALLPVILIAIGIILVFKNS